jgi:hypothetical protein
MLLTRVNAAILTMLTVTAFRTRVATCFRIVRAFDRSIGSTVVRQMIT